MGLRGFWKLVIKCGFEPVKWRPHLSNGTDQHGLNGTSRSNLGNGSGEVRAAPGAARAAAVRPQTLSDTQQDQGYGDELPSAGRGKSDGAAGISRAGGRDPDGMGGASWPCVSILGAAAGPAGSSPLSNGANWWDAIFGGREQACQELCAAVEPAGRRRSFLMTAFRSPVAPSQSSNTSNSGSAAPTRSLG